MQVPIGEAKTHLSKLIEATLAGEEVIISKGQKPVARLVPVSGSFVFGVLDGLVAGVPDFNEPMSKEDLAVWGAI